MRDLDVRNKRESDLTTDESEYFLMQAQDDARRFAQRHTSRPDYVRAVATCLYREAERLQAELDRRNGKKKEEKKPSESIFTFDPEAWKD